VTYLPQADAIPQIEISNFSGAADIGQVDPDATEVAFFLLAGSSTGLSSVSKRDNPGLHFLNCPADVENAHDEHRHTARIMYLDSSRNDCFTITEGGVEGTIVHLPERVWKWHVCQRCVSYPVPGPVYSR
jgi:chitinase